MGNRFFALALATIAFGCSQEPRLDGSSASALESSLAQVTAGLPAADRETFEQAYRTVAVDAALNVTPLEERTCQHASSLLELAAAAKPASGSINALTGLTAADILARSAAIERHRATCEAERVAAEAVVEERVRARLAGYDFAYSNFRVEDSIGIKDARVDVTLTNNSAEVLGAFRFKASIQSPGRSVPWTEDDEFEVLAGGLEPGETRELTVRMSSLSGFTDSWPDDAEFRAELWCVYAPKNDESRAEPLVERDGCPTVRIL